MNMKREEGQDIAGGYDRVATVGSIVVLLALSLLPFLVIRETRISPPGGVTAFRALGIMPFTAIAGLTAVSAFSSRLNSRHHRTMALASISRILILFILWQAGAGAARLSIPELPFARISLGSGAWLSLLGAYMIMSSCRSATRSEHLFRAFCLGFYTALAMLFIFGSLDSLSFMVEFFNRSSRFRQEIIRHISLSFSAVCIGLLLGFPMGLAAFRRERLRAVILSSANTLQTIPSLALFGLLVAPLAWAARSFPSLALLGIGGIGWAPALIALVLYSLLPVIRNTISAFSIIDPSIIDSGLGMGMSGRQLFFRVELPLAMPVVMAGIRISGVQAVGNTAVAALIGAGGLGQFIFQGLGEAAPDLILLGALPTVALALFVDGVLKRCAAILEPGGDS